MSDEHTKLDGISCPVCRAREEQELALLKARQSRMIERCIATSDCINNLRLIPRVIVAGYGYLVWDIVQWFQLLSDPTTQHAALVTTVVGGAGLVFGFYMQGGITQKKQ